MKNKILSLAIIVLLVSTVFIIIWYGKKDDFQENSFNKIPTTIKEISYDDNNEAEFRVYIQEKERYVPFLVISSNYNGNCLLLREFLCNESVAYNEPGEYGSYYNNSIVDRYLNETYYHMFSEQLKNIIVDSTIVITPKSTIDTHKFDLEFINRKVFLLSVEEVNASLSKIAMKEGEALQYFKKIENRIAYDEKFQTSPWMLRTPALRDSNIVIGIANNGAVGIGGISDISGLCESAIRPAFCIPSDTEIIQSNDIIEGKSVFCIKAF